MATDPKNLAQSGCSLKGLVDLKKLRRIFQHFTNPLGLIVAVLDVPTLAPLLTTGRLAIHTPYGRGSRRTVFQNLRNHARHVYRSGHLGQVAIKTCQKGLVCCATPIFIRGKRVAMLATGQVLLKTRVPERFKCKTVCGEIGARKGPRTVEKRRGVSALGLEPMTKFLEDLAVLVAELGYAGLKEREKAERAGGNVDRDEKHYATAKDWQKTFDAVTDAIWLLSPKGKILRANKATFVLFHKRPQQVQGRRCCEIVHGSKNCPEGCPFLRMKKSRRREIWEAKISGRWLRVTVDPIWDRNGKLNSAVLIVSDIAERKRIDDALRQESSFRHAIIENQPGLVWFKDRKGRYLAVNQKFASACNHQNPGGLKGKTDWDLWPEKLARKYQADDAKVMKTGKSIRVEELIKGRKGLEWHETFKTPVRDAKGRILGTSGLAQSITDRKKAEEALRSSDGRLRLQIRRMPLGCILWDPDFRVLSWNPAAEKIFGYKDSEAQGCKAYGLIVPRSSRSRVRAVWKKLFRGNAPAHVINENITKKGETIVCKWNNTLLRGGDGKVFGVLSMVEDITAERQMAKELRLARFSIDHANNPVYWIGSDGSFLYVNDAVCRLLGYTRQELFKMRVSDIDPHFPQARWETHWRELRQRKHMIFESHQKTKTGRLIPLEVNINYLEFEGKGYNFAFASDITERKQAENALQEHRHQLRDIIDTVPHMIFAKDREDRFLLVNRAVSVMYGKEPHELIGVRRRDVHPEFKELFEALKKDKEVFSAGKPQVESDEVFTDIRGRKHVLQTTRIPFRMAGVEERCILVVSVDITEQKKVEEFRNDIIRTVSHELRTPLSIEKEGISLLMDGMAGPVTPEQRQLLETIMRSIDRLSRMITNLLDVSRIETGKTELHLTVTDIRNIVRDVAFQFKKRASEKGIELEARCPEEEVIMRIDPDKITQVLSNLVDNAVKFTPPRGKIEMTLETLRDQVQCSVRDSGIGIARDNLPKVFEKFRQFSRKAGPGEKGFGLGLSIAKGLVELHGGRIWAESDAGQGALIAFTLPLIREKEA